MSDRYASKWDGSNEIRDVEEASIDYSVLAQAVDEIREVCNVAVAGLMADGFTDREARAIIAGFFAAKGVDSGTD